MCRLSIRFNFNITAKASAPNLDSSSLIDLRLWTLNASKCTGVAAPEVEGRWGGRFLETSKSTADNSLGRIVRRRESASRPRDTIADASKGAASVVVSNKAVRLLRFISSALDEHKEY